MTITNADLVAMFVCLVNFRYPLIPSRDLGREKIEALALRNGFVRRDIAGRWIPSKRGILWENLGLSRTAVRDG